MKIKAVCAATGLSDRTVRYYIEEGLIAPKYTENYLGRKTFDFTQQDIKELKKISVLRSYDFSVEEIRNIIQDSTKSQSIINAVRQRIQKSVSDGESKLAILMELDKQKQYTFSDLAEVLTNISYNAALKTESVQVSFRKSVGSFLKSAVIFIIVWFPIALSIFLLLKTRIRYYYPVYDFKGFLLLLLFLLPSILMLIISKIEFRWRKIVKCILLILCVLSVPYCAVCSALDVIICSETNAIRHYREFDVQLGLNTNTRFDELFPKYAHTYDTQILEDGSKKNVPVDAKYYYRYMEDFDSSYDVYVQWTLQKENFYNEIDRVERFLNSMQ